MAYAMDPCKFQNISNPAHVMMDHTMDGMSPEVRDMQCCETEHLCSMNGCLPSALVNNVELTKIIAQSQKIIQAPLIAKSYIPTSLYRPPFIR